MSTDVRTIYVMMCTSTNAYYVGETTHSKKSHLTAACLQNRIHAENPAWYTANPPNVLVKIAEPAEPGDLAQTVDAYRTKYGNVSSIRGTPATFEKHRGCCMLQ